MTDVLVDREFLEELGATLDDAHLTADGDTQLRIDACISKLRAALDAKPVEPVELPEGLHSETKRLVRNFASAMAEKLYAAELKYGYSNGWSYGDWMDECRAKLLEHLAKGDPRDVANYCAFLWYHNEPTAAHNIANDLDQAQKRVAELEVENKMAFTQLGDQCVFNTQLIEERAALTAENEKLRAQLGNQTCYVPPEFQAEMARYRWLVDNCVTRADDSALPQLQHNVPTTDAWLNRLEDAIDEAIDAAKDGEGLR